MNNNINIDFLKKYNKPGPRYTSYPTAPEWSDSFSYDDYVKQLESINIMDKSPFSLYVHIPFCEERCLYCGCHSIIDKNRLYVNKYIDYLDKEFSLFKNTLKNNMPISQLHWGGGTPTFLNEGQIEKLFNSITKNFSIDKNAEIAIEIDPNITSKQQVKLLKQLGFNRISMGVQDLNPIVQKAVNRMQDENNLINLINYSRNNNFISVNIDLIYGLPMQTVESFTNTIEKILSISPDRIALFSYAKIPWLKPHQKKINDKDCPSVNEKLSIFLKARELLLKNNYCPIGMDHFAKPNDELSIALKNKSLHRNFMGYTIKSTEHFIGFGISSIGYVNKTFVQNLKSLKDYYNTIDNNKFPIDRGLKLNNDDLIRQWVISTLMCQFELDYADFYKKFNTSFSKYFNDEINNLNQFIKDDLISISNNKIKIKEKGTIFIRNICMVFDSYLKSKERQFSKTI